MSPNPRAPELPADFAWLNTARPLSFSKNLRGQVVLLDFIPASPAWSVPVRFDEQGEAQTQLSASLA